jgi:hypothetical protein
MDVARDGEYDDECCPARGWLTWRR